MTLTRPQRRKLDAAQAKDGFRSEAPPTLEDVASLARVLHKHVAQAKARRNVYGLVTGLYALIAKSEQRFADIPIACKRGCSHCCNIWVDCTAPELLYLHRTLSAPPSALDMRIESFREKWGTLDFDARSDLVTPCPLLEQNVCTVYEHRPLNCRLAVSSDADICQRSIIRRSGEKIPVPAVYVRASGVYGQALAAALKHEGLPHAGYELASALAILRSERNAETRWFDGEDIFASARQAPNAEDEKVISTIATLAFDEGHNSQK